MFEIETLRPQQLIVSGLGKRSGLKSTIAFLDLPSDAPPRPIFGCSSCSLDCFSHSDTGLRRSTPRRTRVSSHSKLANSAKTPVPAAAPSLSSRAYGCRHLRETSYSPPFRTSSRRSTRRVGFCYFYWFLGHLFRRNLGLGRTSRTLTRLCCTSAVRRRLSRAQLDWSGISNADVGR
jgi:hypothetical protein